MVGVETIVITRIDRTIPLHVWYVPEQYHISTHTRVSMCCVEQNIQQQIFNMDQQNFAIESVKSTKETVAAMQHGVKALKAEFKTMSLDNVDDVMDDMADLMDDTNEMQEIMAQTYGAPECDESELEAELACLDDLNFEDDSIFSEIEAPAGGLEVPAAAEPAKVAEGEEDYGLPALPS